MPIFPSPRTDGRVLFPARRDIRDAASTTPLQVPARQLLLKEQGSHPQVTNLIRSFSKHNATRYRNRNRTLLQSPYTISAHAAIAACDPAGNVAREAATAPATNALPTCRETKYEPSGHSITPPRRYLWAPTKLLPLGNLARYLGGSGFSVAPQRRQRSWGPRR